MTFRSDHDAALARADALQQQAARAEAELERTQQDLERTRAKLAETEQARDQLANRLLPNPDRNHPTGVSAPQWRAPAFLTITVVIGGMMAGVWFATKSDEHQASRVQAPRPYCTFTSTPEGAQVFDAASNKLLGTTPYQVNFEDAPDRLVLRRGERQSQELNPYMKMLQHPAKSDMLIGTCSIVIEL
ncbi:MAG: hypothetical protein AB7P03_20160 [Kofleriaceae bacterium]